MIAKRLRIYRGADKSFLVRLKSMKTEDPYSLDGVSLIQIIFINHDRSKLILTTDTIPKTKALAVLGDVTFSSVEGGAKGNNILLNFNGIDTIAEIVTAWNSANQTNTVTHNAEDDSQVIASQSVPLRLNGGYDAYQPVSVYGEPQLGKIAVVLLEKETARLRTGNNNSFSVIIDNGQNVGGDRNIGTFEQKVDIKDSIV